LFYRNANVMPLSGNGLKQNGRIRDQSRSQWYSPANRRIDFNPESQLEPLIDLPGAASLAARQAQSGGIAGNDGATAVIEYSDWIAKMREYAWYEIWVDTSASPPYVLILLTNPLAGCGKTENFVVRASI
jgi:hypothetical protein